MNLLYSLEFNFDINKVNFHGSFPQAHSVGDTGGDVLNEFELNMKYISDLSDWYIPVDDLYHIYIDLYGKERVTREDIVECSSLLFIGRYRLFIQRDSLEIC